MDSQFVLRRADLSDAEALAKLFERTYRETFVEVFCVGYPEKDLNCNFRSSASPEWFSKIIVDSHQAVWVIEDQTNDELVAYAVVGPAHINDMPHSDLCSNLDGALTHLFVQYNYQSRGLGKKLMNVILPWLEEHHPGRPIWLNVWSGNLKAQKFYTPYGFIKVGEANFPVGEWTDHDFIMKRQPNKV